MRSESRAATPATLHPSASARFLPTPAVIVRGPLRCRRRFQTLKIRRDFLKRQCTQFSSIPCRHGASWITGYDVDAWFDHRLNHIFSDCFRSASIGWIDQASRPRRPQPQRRSHSSIGSRNSRNGMADRTAGSNEDDSEWFVTTYQRNSLRRNHGHRWDHR